MPRTPPRASLVALLLAAIVTGFACNREQASVEELYTTRMVGLGFLERNQLTEAESAFRKLTDLAPDDPLGYANLGLTYLQAGRLADAEKQLDKARKLDPRSTEVGLMLARLYALTNRADRARTTLEALRRDSASDPHVLYALAELEAQRGDSAGAAYEQRLRELLAVAPASLVARLKLLQALARRGESDSVVKHLEEVRRIPPEPPKEARVALDSTIRLLRAGKSEDARASLDRFVALMQVTPHYQASLEEVRWVEGPIAGQTVLDFAPKSFASLGGVRARATVEVAKYVDATEEVGLARALPAGDSLVGAVAVGDVDGNGTDDVFIGNSAGAKLFRNQGGFFRDATERAHLALASGARFATFADYDNDGWLDLLVVGSDQRLHLFRNRGDGTFEDATAKARLGDAKGALRAVFVDLDHDGDLDLLLTGEPTAVYRNNLDGTFTEATAAFGIGAGPSSDAAYADFDGDGRTDLLIASAQGDALYHNGGAERFSNVSGAAGVTGASATASVGDYDNDGSLDILAGQQRWHNAGNGSFVRDARSAIRTAPAIAEFLDYDNDGWLDLVLGAPGGLSLLRNDGTGRLLDRSARLPDAARTAGVSALAVTDVDGDGDEDVLLLDRAGAPHLLRNDLGNSNLAVNVRLNALRSGSGKNNVFGIGARLELRAGDIYQTRVATGRTTHFGLGPHLKADVLRVEWPNGVPQTVYLPGSDQDVVEREMLKGSCAFAYTWDGTRFRFVTDAMWRSALGMPLGLMGGSAAFAPAGASQEYVRIPGDAWVPKDGKYLLQLTEELWETAYADQIGLVAVDHPDSVDVFVDERFVPPGPVGLQLFQVARRSYPRSAVDERGNDVLPALRASDDVYVSDLTPTRYQGVVDPHDLVMDLGPDAGTADSHLFLRGWIYPTDASINVALGQQPAVKVSAPALEARDASGRWKVVADIGFPSGKDKTIAIDLAGKFATSDHHVRIRTNMQIYWDEAFVSRVMTDPAVSRLTKLAPVAADLHERGFSRMYRKGGRYGPYWFDYSQVTKENPWRPITGSFTRFGDVLPLLQGSDDRYVIMAPGDEATIAFDASSARSIPPGWKRDFFLYTDGWIKDSDLNTAHGTTVGPLPYHAVKSYPYAPGDAYPTDSAHQRYLREYNTRQQ